MDDENVKVKTLIEQIIIHDPRLCDILCKNLIKESYIVERDMTFENGIFLHCQVNVFELQVIY